MLSFSLVAEDLTGLIYHRPSGENSSFQFSSTVAVAQWVRRWSSGHRVAQAENSGPDEDMYQILFSAMTFISVLLGLSLMI